MAERDSATAFPLDRARVPTAVSRTLSGSERVNEFSRQRVLGAGHSLFDHVPEREAPGLAQKGPTALGRELRYAVDALLFAGCSTRPLDVPFELPLGWSYVGRVAVRKTHLKRPARWSRKGVLMKTRVIAAALLASSLVMTGCGRAESGSPAGPATGSAVATASVSGELTMWAMGAEGDNLPKLLKDFTDAHPGIKVTVTAVPWASAHDKFANSITANTTPDLAMVGTTWMGEFAELGALDPTPGNIDKAKFFPGAAATADVGGTSYGVPWYVETRLVYYRKDLAAKAGLTEVPKDWDSFKQFVTKMKDVSGVKYPISLQPGKDGSWQTVMPFAWSNGAELATADAYTLDTPQMAEAWTYYQSFFNGGLANKAPAEGGTEADFASGKVPMFISGPWMMSAVEKTGGSGFADKYDVFQIPARQSSSSFIGGSNLVVFKNTKARDAAWTLAEWLTQPDVQVKWYGISTDLPSVQSAWQDPKLTEDPKLAKFGEQMKTAKAPPTFSTWEQVASKFDTQVERVTKQNADVAQALKTLQSQATSIGTGK